MVDHDFHSIYIYTPIFVFFHFIFHFSLSLSPHRHPEGSLSKSSGSFMFNSFSPWKSMQIYPNHHLPQQNRHISRPNSRLPGAREARTRRPTQRTPRGRNGRWPGGAPGALTLAQSWGGFSSKRMLDFHDFPWGCGLWWISIWGFHGISISRNGISIWFSIFWGYFL